MRLALLALIALSTASWAEGPGSQLRAGRPAPQPAGAAEKDLQRCEALRGEAKQRCLRELRAAMRADDRPPHAGPSPESGPGSTSMGSSAGSGASTGASGGGSAPR